MREHGAVIEARDLHAAYGSREALAGISLTVQKNTRWAIIGPNGAGKSTLIKIIAGLTKPSNGVLLIDGVPLGHYRARARARTLAYMPQKPEGVIPYTVHDFVMLGRYCAMGILGMPSKDDRTTVAEAIEICDVRHLATRLMSTLSGGELQRVLLAGAVAQAAPLVLLDEPTTFLDPAHERLFFEALSRLREKRESTIVMITHDINNALLQCTHIAALREGKLLFSGAAGEFKGRCPAILDELFGVRFGAFAGGDGKTEVFGSWEARCRE